MANLMQLINKSKTIEEKARVIAADVISQFKHGQIKTKPELIYKTFEALQRFYKSIGKPTMVKRYAKGTPSSSDYNNTVREIYNDLSVLINETENLSQVLGDAYNRVEVDRQSLDNQLNLVENKLNKAKFKLDNIYIKNVFIDSFINMNYADNDSCTLSPATINTNFGYISLTVTESCTVNENAAIEILDGSSGFPGNTHQINIINNEPKFLGEEGLHLNLADILDNNSDTWFEYEVYKINEETLLKTLNLQYDYEEGIKWITESNKLVLGIKISFESPKLINTLSMSSFIPPDKDAVPSIIKEIIISDGKGTIRNLINGLEIFDNDKVYSFPKQYCKTATIFLEQELPYTSLIGHLCYKELSNQNVNAYELNESKFSQITDGPKPKVENLNIIYDDVKQKYIQPVYKYGEKIDNEETIKNNLFNVPESNSNIKGSIEALTANRFHIGIRDITLSNYSYQSDSEYISKSFTSDKPIKEISLSVKDFIPEIFNDITDIDGNEIEWIKYFISVNEGKEWFAIIPDGKISDKGYSTYFINSGTPAELRRNDVGYIEMAEDIFNVKLKIVLKRPTNIPDSEYYSPIVYEYKLKAN